MFEFVMSKSILAIFAFTALLNHCRSQQCPCNDGLIFRGDNTQQYGISPGMPKPLSSISVCLWIKMPKCYSEDHDATVISYATGSSTNEFYVSVYRGSTIVAHRAPHVLLPENVGNIPDDKLHHVCITWKLLSGEMKMYEDGVNISTKNVPTDNIMAGGTWVIGQDQDTVGGGFQAKDSFKGSLAEVNVWDRILCPYEIAALASSCGPIMKGNVKAHNDFVIHGGIETFKPECCLN